MNIIIDYTQLINNIQSSSQINMASFWQENRK